MGGDQIRHPVNVAQLCRQSSAELTPSKTRLFALHTVYEHRCIIMFGLVMSDAVGNERKGRSKKIGDGNEDANALRLELVHLMQPSKFPPPNLQHASRAGTVRIFPTSVGVEGEMAFAQKEGSLAVSLQSPPGINPGVVGAYTKCNSCASNR